MSQFHIWENRWATLNAVIDNVLTDLAPDQEQVLPRQRTLYWLVRSLQAFAADQIGFFQKGFTEDSPFKLQPSEDYPEAYVFRTTLDQVSNDLAVIEQIIQQRRDNRTLVINDEPINLNDRLHQADQLAQLALEPAVKAGIIGKTAVITYFQKSPSIRVLPYASVALIAIPYTSISNDRDLLAIPHEVGHYIYRHGRSLRHELEQLIPSRPAWRRRWLEEIFSDVYGALIAGPVLALSFQELLMGKPVNEFMHDHGHHPVPFLRPFIYHTVLKKTGYDFGDAVDELQKLWNKARRTRGLPEGFVPQGHGESDPVPERKAQKYLRQAIAIIMSKVQNGHEPWFCDPYEVQAPAKTSFTEQLYINFEHKIADLTNQSAAETEQKVKLNELFDQEKINQRARSDSPTAPVSVAIGDRNGHNGANDVRMLATQQASFAMRAKLGVVQAHSFKSKSLDNEVPINVRLLGTTGTWIDQVKLFALGNAPKERNSQQTTTDPILIPPHLWAAILSTDGWNTGGPDSDWAK